MVKTELFANILDQKTIRFNHDLITDISSVLNTQNLTLSLAETISAGRLTQYISKIQHANTRFLGSISSTHPITLITLLGLSPNTLKEKGLCSNECTRQLAKQMKKITKSHIAIASTGAQLPNTNTYRVITHIEFLEKELTKTIVITGSEATIQDQSAITALTLLRLLAGQANMTENESMEVQNGR